MKKSNKTIDLKYQFQKRNNNFERSQLTEEVETAIKYMNSGGDGQMIPNRILGDICCEMEVQVISDELKNCKEFLGEVASENSRWVDAAA